MNINSIKFQGQLNAVGEAVVQTVVNLRDGITTQRRLKLARELVALLEEQLKLEGQLTHQDPS